MNTDRRDQISDNLCSSPDEDRESTRVARLDELFAEQDTNLDVAEAANTVIGIRESEFRTYLAVVDYPESTTSELSNVLDTAYTNIHQRLTKLREKGLVSRQRVIADSEGGGHKYEYEAQSLAETRQQIREEIDEWSEAIEDQMTALQDPVN